MPTTLALTNLYDLVVARFALDGTDAESYFGWREPSKNKVHPRRVVWVPGDESGALGELLPPRGPGNNARPIANLGELFTLYVSAYDATDAATAENERAQYVVTRLLYDATIRAIHLAAHGTFAIVSSDWNTDKNERRNGAEIIVVGTVRAVIPDVAYEVAPDDTEADITTDLEDVSEKTIEPAPP